MYAFGLFSEQRGGLVPHPNWSKETRLMKGEPEEVIRALRKRIIRYVIGGIIALGAGAGVLFAFISHHNLI